MFQETDTLHTASGNEIVTIFLGGNLTMCTKRSKNIYLQQLIPRKKSITLTYIRRFSLELFTSFIIYQRKPWRQPEYALREI